MGVALVPEPQLPGLRVTCERCGQPSDRRRGEVAPDGWYFGAFGNDAAGAHVPGSFLIVYACSDECRLALWTRQAGHTWAEIERRVDVCAEIMRIARLHADALKREARDFLETLYPDDTLSTSRAPARCAAVLNAAADELLAIAEAEVEAIRYREHHSIGS